MAFSTKCIIWSPKRTKITFTIPCLTDENGTRLMRLLEELLVTPQPCPVEQHRNGRIPHVKLPKEEP